MESHQAILDNVTNATARRRESGPAAQAVLNLHRMRGARSAGRRLQDAIGSTEIRQQLDQDRINNITATMERHITNQDAERHALEAKVRLLEYLSRQKDIMMGALEQTREAKDVEIAILERTLQHKPHY
ncbi:uncharacterized protein BDZ99DRAFT_525859 [Mytilinidion resinicola]|uniref:Uncharacterized protein n=1 Tax=Mytilinidion resinicola TaxID=574789 RepID=A0A6A6Y7V6_9PEZI|nr:uncharacterized protein BDZ99DRAFT_525859 [Mytilinidion resinicola]KAF2804265.1 hypothetical protein BDZ99DRAFT_525859 [Mytilinidion resinicola]